MPTDLTAPLVAALLNPTLHAHGLERVERVEHVETHISHVFLAGGQAYKLKKPVNLGFLDFSSLAARQHYCAEEVRLNRRLAPALYLDCVALMPYADGYALRPIQDEGADQAEWLVHMRRFDPALQLDHLLARGELTPGHMDALALILANFHLSLPPSPAPYGNAENVIWPVRDNFAQIRPLLNSAAEQEALAGVAALVEAEIVRLTPQFQARRAEGLVRECHGDLHLGNIALVDGRPLPFDALEFNPDLRHIDVMSDMAFLTMDLQHHGRPDLAARCLNAWLEVTGDYAGVALLPFYQRYRAMVRAKVAAIRAAQAGADDTLRRSALAEYQAYLARAGAALPQPRLILTHGLSGSGKTYTSQMLLEALGAIRLRSDVERKRLFGLNALTRSSREQRPALYGRTASEQTYQRLLQLTEVLLQAGQSVIVDAAFLRRDQRAPFLALAQKLALLCRILHCQAPPDVLNKRILARQSTGKDASEADSDVLQQQRQSQEALTPEEQAISLGLDTQALELEGLVDLAGRCRL